MGHHLRFLPLLLSLPTLLLASGTLAEDTTTADPLKLQTSTSGYADQDVQWTPGSITVITQDEIEATFRRTLEDLEGYVPGMIVDSLSGSPQGAAISLRGITSNNSSLGFEPSVAVVVDGVYIGSHDAQNQHLFDFETIEIARGPQGMFTPVPAEGGAIYLTRTKPTGELGVKTRLSVGDFNGSNVDSVINFPILEELAGKISFALQNREGSDLKNRVVDRREYGIDRASYGLSLLWQAPNNWTAQYSLDLDRDDSETPGLLNLSQPTDLVCVPDPSNPNALANCASPQELRLPESGSRQRFVQNFSSEREYEADTQSLKIEGELFGHTISSITGFRRTKTTSNQDLDGTSTDRHSVTESNDYDQFSTELTARGVYSDNLSYTVGLSLLNTEYDLFRRDFFVLDTLTTGNTIAPGLLPNQVLTIQSGQESTTVSAFAHGVYRWDEQWTFDFGLRGLMIEKDYDQTTSGLSRTNGATPINTVITGTRSLKN